MRPGLLRRPIGLVAAALVVTGCSDPSAATAGPAGSAVPSATSPQPSGLSATVVQYRRDQERDVLQVKVTNGGTSPVKVGRVSLDSGAFRAPVVEEKDATIAAGVSVDLTLPLGAAACGAERVPLDVVMLDVDGRSVVLPVVGEELDQIRDRRCELQAVLRLVGLGMAPDWTATEVGGRPGVTGALEVSPRGGADDVTVSVEGATTLFTIVEPAAVELEEGSAAVTLPLTLVVARCDPHAVAEDKKGYLMPVRVVVAEAPAVLVEVPVPVPERAPLQTLLDRSC